MGVSCKPVGKVKSIFSHIVPLKASKDSVKVKGAKEAKEEDKAEK